MLENKILDQIKESKTAFHAVNTMVKALLNEGYQELFENESWKLNEGKYFVRRNNSSLIAFNIGADLSNYSFNIVASHTDSPTFKLKPNFEIENKSSNKLNTEGYGGMLDATWFDRPLGIAGRCLIKDQGIKEVLVDLEKPMVTIPSLAIHLNRNANNNATYNNQVDMLPMCGTTNIKKELLAKLGCNEEALLGFDLYLYNCERGYLWGNNNEFISAPQLDNLECCFTSLEAFLAVNPVKSINVVCSFDSEEVGSRTKQGAGGTFLQDVLKRINYSLGFTEEDYLKAISQSYLVSADNAHASHPNYESLYDQTNRTYMNKGVVIKYNSNGSYTTDGLSESILINYLKDKNIPYQKFTNRSDMRGGSTLGNISLSQVSLMSVDIGLPILAMHSASETGGAYDIDSMIDLLKEVYSHHIYLDKGTIKID